MKLTVTTRKLVGTESDVVVAEEGDVKITVPFFCPPGGDRDDIVAEAKNRAKACLHLEQEHFEAGR